ncbi:hypothetical protein ANCCAN_01696 [Ancylostoma caninum]|uniref:Uncharacterized protein n=1 Tax=Ancylostoma caninum TaxID=29170 RepID=A0A368H6M5_ANCCA|nr:hypothetical protein ANCCAN_01696 [Ancylostoma caninum]
MKLYPLSGGLFLTYGDLRWFLTQTMEKIVMHDLYNMIFRAISEVIWDWYCGRQNTIEIYQKLCLLVLHQISMIFLRKLLTRSTTGEHEDGRFALLKRNFDGEMKQLLVMLQSNDLLSLEGKNVVASEVEHIVSQSFLVITLLLSKITVFCMVHLDCDTLIPPDHT